MKTKHNIPKHMGHRESKSNRAVSSNKCVYLKTRKISNNNLTLLLRNQKKKSNLNPKLAKGRKKKKKTGAEINQTGQKDNRENYKSQKLVL